MPRVAVKTCRDCGRHADEVGLLSWSRLCTECGDRRRAENHVAMRTMDGPYAHHWRRRMAASVGAVLPEDLP